MNQPLKSIEGVATLRGAASLAGATAFDGVAARDAAAPARERVSPSADVARRGPVADSATVAEAGAADGDWPTLLACFLHFDLSFMLWVLLGALGIFIAEQLGLSAAQKGFLVAVPILSGSLARVPIGWLGDRVGAKRVGALLLASLFVPLTLGWLWGGSLPVLIATGLLLGTAGASFAVALPLASRWYPPRRQGLAMGIAAAGNSGTVITNLLAPRLAAAIGWQNVLGLAMAPLALVLLAFIWMAKDRPAPPRARPLRETLAERDLWWFCLFYSVTFGGYVGLTSFLPLLLRDQYRLATLAAGQATAIVALMGSASRPIGGYLADRLGGARVLTIALAGIAVTYAAAARLPSAGAMIAAIFVAMACLGLGNGAVFQLVPRRFRDEIGVVTGVIGAVGGLGGFVLPALLGSMKQATGSFAPAFLVLATIAGVAAVCLRRLAADLGPETGGVAR